MKKITVISQKALVSICILSFIMMIILLPKPTLAQCPSSVVYSSAGSGSFTFTGTFPSTPSPVKIRVNISAGTGNGTTKDLTVSSSNTTTIVTNTNGLDSTSVASTISYLDGSNTLLTGWTTCSTSTPLPVTLISFTGTSQGLVNILTWKTGTEINNDKFVIERSNGTGEYFEIGTVQGSGNTNQIKEYQFIDNNPLPGSNIYKLIQFDFNGVSESFNPIIIKSNNEGVKFTVNPNPSNGIFSVRSDEVFQQNPFQITNSVGQIVYTSTTSNADVDISIFSPGIYTLNSIGNLPTKILVVK